MPIDTVCVCQTERMKITAGMTPEIEANLMDRIRQAIDLFSPGTQVLVNPEEEILRERLRQVDCIVGTEDITMEGLGAPLIPAVDRLSGPSYDSYICMVNRFSECLRTAMPRDELVLSRMEFSTDDYPRYGNPSTSGARQMWERMWLDRRKGEQA